MITANVKYVGKQDQIYTYGRNINKLIEISAYSLLDLSYKAKAGKNSEFEVFVENVFDKKYEEKFGYPISGRMSGVSYKINF
ncbi:MAG: hypothetical protein QMC67_09690 [Candidatus Wallbacteria bacterium]